MEQILKKHSGTELKEHSIINVLENLPRAEVQKWFAGKAVREPFFYTSVDIRNSGHKLAAIDTNLFPAGWNNLSEQAKDKASTVAREYFAKYYPYVKTAAILAENFSRNQFYWQNIENLRDIISSAGLDVKIYIDDLEASREANIPHTDYNFAEDIVILNRDFTAGVPENLREVKKPIVPSPDMGWFQRRKSVHFDAYNKLVADFAKHFNFDPWLISSFHTNCGQVNFKERQGLDCVAANVDKIIAQIKTKYAEYGITSEPYVYVKSNSGTFGMGIMTTKSGNEVLEMNKKLRNKMDVIKEGVQSTEVIIQEGIPTVDKVGEKTAEPFIYLLGGVPVGGIIRVNQNRDAFGNLNSSGMEFEKMECEQIANPCDYSPLGLVARIAALAALDEKY